MSGVLLPLLSRLPEVEPDAQPHLFCCENDHDAVMKLKAALNGRVFVIDCERACHATTESVRALLHFTSERSPRSACLHSHTHRTDTC